MPLIQKKVVVETLVEYPDRDGGWYWFYTGKKWEPMFVSASLDGWDSVFTYSGRMTSVRNTPDGCTWGDMIKPCSQQRQMEGDKRIKSVAEVIDDCLGKSNA